MGNSTKRTATIYECGNCDYSYVRKIVFDYAVSPDYKVGTHKGYSYGMTVDYSDLTNQTVTQFRVTTFFTYSGSAAAHYYITPTGSMNKELGFISGVDDKTGSIADAVGYVKGEDTSKEQGGYVDFEYSKVKNKTIYFVFINQNYVSSFTVKTLWASAVFDFGEPNL